MAGTACFCILPMMSSRLLRVREHPRRLLRWSEEFFQGLKRSYCRLLERAYRHYANTVLLRLAALGAGVFRLREFKEKKEIASLCEFHVFD